MKFLSRYYLEIILAFPVVYVSIWLITGIAIYGIH